MSKTFKIVNGDISDGYHTFDELYEHRCLLFINLCLMQPEKCAWKFDYPGWFCLYLETPKGQISYHLPVQMLRLITAIKKDQDYKWDGHTSQQVLERLS
jgi:hypothetical protein